MKVLLTGGSGLLGTELRKLDPDIIAPTHQEMDICDWHSVNECIRRVNPDIIIHAAAYTNTWGPEGDALEKLRCWNTNVVGTHFVDGCAFEYGAHLALISTDAVFDGLSGSYSADEHPFPMNYYGASKLASEWQLRDPYTRSCVIRTSFRHRPWPYPQAPTDAYTSADYVDVIAPLVLTAALSKNTGIIHLGTGRKSFFDLAKQTKPDVLPCSRMDMPEPRPAPDLSLI